jgi:hypothetical protein
VRATLVAFGDAWPTFTFEEFFDGQCSLIENIKENISLLTNKFKRLITSTFLESNIITTDETIHVIEDVIIPPYFAMNLIKQMFNDQSITFTFTTVVNLAVYAGLDDEVNDMYDHGITMLVPPTNQ